MIYRGNVDQSSRHHQANDKKDFDSFSKGDRFYIDRILSVPVLLMPLVLAWVMAFFFGDTLELE